MVARGDALFRLMYGAREEACRSVEGGVDGEEEARRSCKRAAAKRAGSQRVYSNLQLRLTHDAAPRSSCLFFFFCFFFLLEFLFIVGARARRVAVSARLRAAKSQGRGSRRRGTTQSTSDHELVNPPRGRWHPLRDAAG